MNIGIDEVNKHYSLFIYQQSNHCKNQAINQSNNKLIIEETVKSTIIEIIPSEPGRGIDEENNQYSLFIHRKNNYCKNQAINKSINQINQLINIPIIEETGKSTTIEIIPSEPSRVINEGNNQYSLFIHR